MRDFHSLSVTEQLYRLAEIAHQPYTRSTRERRACVALIFRLAPSTTPPSPPQPHPTHPTRPPPPPPSHPPAPAPAPPTPPPTASPYRRYLDPSPSYPRLIDALHGVSRLPTTRAATLHLLFIQRARNPRDRWSGQMALPGGRQQAGETDWATCVREVEEEVGLRLTDADALYIGRMSDRHINSYGNVRPLAVCPFIFLWTGAAPPLRLDAKEVGAAVWTPLSYFTSDAVRFGYMVHPLVIQTRDRWRRRGGRRRVEVGYRVRRMDSALSAPSLAHPVANAPTAAASGMRGLLPSKLPNLFNVPSVQFPALALPGEFETADARRGVSLGDTLLYHPPASVVHAAGTTSSSFPSHASPSPLLSTPVAPTSSLPIRSAEESADDPSAPASSSASGDIDGDAEVDFASKMEHDIDVAPGTFILWGFTLVLVSDLLRDGLGVRTLSDRIDAGQGDRARMLQWLHSALDVVEKAGKGWNDAKETGMRLLSGGGLSKHDDERSSTHSEKQVAASLKRGIAAAADSATAAEAAQQGSVSPDTKVNPSTARQQTALPSRL